MTDAIIMDGRKDRAGTEIVSITLVICPKITKCQAVPNALWNILMTNEHISLSQLESPHKSNKPHNLVFTDYF